MGTEVQNVSDGITIVVPVGPDPVYKKYLSECLDSIRTQMQDEDEIIIVDDKAKLIDDKEFISSWKPTVEQYIVNPWLLGCAASWNIGVARAKNNLVLLAGSDDKLLPGALDALRKAHKNNNYRDAWYNLTVNLQDGTQTSVFNNAAAVTKGLWNLTGGFPVSAGVGGPDALLISILLKHMPDRLIQVEEGKSYYWCRQHPAQDTLRQAAFFSGEIVSIRNRETVRWKQPEWTPKR